MTPEEQIPYVEYAFRMSVPTSESTAILRIAESSHVIGILRVELAVTPFRRSFDATAVVTTAIPFYSRSCKKSCIALSKYILLVPPDAP